MDVFVHDMSTTASSLSILIVEDSADDFFFLERSFKLAEISNVLHHADDGQRAIDYLQGVAPFNDRATYPLPSLVLLDLKLPLMHGFEVLSWIRKHPATKNIVVIVMTSSSEDKDVEKAYELGANAFLVKPASIDKLTDIVRSLDVFWLRHNKFGALPSVTI
jgi:CheY-like chemotaxis protein